MSLRARLLAELNRPWRKDPLPAPGLVLAYDGPGSITVTITETAIALTGEGGAPSLARELEADTLATLVLALAQLPGVTASAEPGSAALLATTLLEEVDRPLTVAPGTFLVWTSPNWRVLEPARRLLRATAARLDVAIAQLNLLTSAGFFAELWGRYTTTLRRPPVHLPITTGAITVTAGSTFAVAHTPGTYAVWRAAERDTGLAALYAGATLIVGDTRATIVARRFKNINDMDSMQLTAGWPGPSQTAVAYRIEFPAESDAVYTARQRHELLRPRENNVALARAVTEDTGIMVHEVRDVRRLVYVVGGPLRGRPMPGARYNTATAEVLVDGLPTLAVIAAAHQHAAAGITVLVRGAMRLRAGASDTIVRTRRATIGPVPVMQIGVGRIGRTRIG